MNSCIVCGKEFSGTEGYQFHVLEVRTLHIRDIDRERRVQALGNFRDYGVCRECEGKELEQSLRYIRGIRGKLIRFSAVALAGSVLAGAAAVKITGNRVFLMLGIAAVICGILGMIQSVSDGRRRAAELSAMSAEEAEKSAAWEAMKKAAPRKDGDNDLTYIPADGTTAARKNGDLMILYDLLPEIAVEAHKKIREEAGMADYQ